ncbi:MAG: hypothetical protein ABSH22_04140 [Tepidisphaeraceae bacterium]
MFLLGLIGCAVALPGLKIHGITFQAHTLLVSTLALQLGYQAIWFAIAAKVFAIREHLLPEDARLDSFFRLATLERGLLAGGLAFLGGVGLIGWMAWRWAASGWGPLDYRSTMRVVLHTDFLFIFPRRCRFGEEWSGICLPFPLAPNIKFSPAAIRRGPPPAEVHVRCS